MDAEDSIKNTEDNFLPLSGGDITGDLTVGGEAVWHAGNDGASSGLNADTVDGKHASDLVPKTGGANINCGIYSIANDAGASIENSEWANGIQIFQPTPGADAFMTFHISGQFAFHFGLDGDTNQLVYGGWLLGANKYPVWNAISMPYEVGTWTPTVYGLSGGTAVLSWHDCVYQRIGNMVTLTGGFQLSSKNGMAGYVKIGGLPYTPTKRGGGTIAGSSKANLGLHVDPYTNRLDLILNGAIIDASLVSDNMAIWGFNATYYIV